ncbi:hypothetical protein [Oscillibacter sp.]|uniref:hypothetical protein n=1 Tax=Oscillibacter sp. TaxID=1945593 RepID=UPI0033992829
MQIYWIFIIIAVFVLIFSGKIDAAAKADKKLKKLLIGACILLVVANTILIVISLKAL